MAQPPTRRMTIISSPDNASAILVELFTTLRAGVSRAVRLMGDTEASELLANICGAGEAPLCRALPTCDFLTPLAHSQTSGATKCSICPFAAQGLRGFASPVEYIDNALAVLLDPHARDLFALAAGYKFDPARVNTTRERRRQMLWLIEAIKSQLDALPPPNIDANGANSATTPRSRSSKG